ncbi:protein WHAT'S THIS FACTOR 9, mitochondrial-like [Macadamia integrifolia]|uniref:protein WHAT'S THIS FACTOR 9, mitochondrial-like n=1 Tax=Macadamia integrifolia TaxID=60698 RepID=UPI001C4FCFF0|nr:protein WHAT'S THIS FACTOR 9, mitochondrial-like [Macadamia integrifolia]XP_042489581.1 protein WHAT'S THIS FACTOR 9, mitochondrial-like [Macadamia integrifolia]XP_042489582.1 protein WHAT'S THIS FACTOR 9, mitochondrial-like [Macadamia integrifolia]XP_042489583.1 protein WHAT'S THIS FACTOR 9, mitochondrial-like [Macadamia integrifolia]XP_042489584.1 protein WHAT'S THIS FACTOR 9, mitochondrial-like [Macadamia integrifolia]
MVIFRCLARNRPEWLWQQQSCRTFVDAKIKWVRERGLDHAVEKEKHLRPMLALKSLIKSEPSKSLPVSVAAENKERLSLPYRAIEFIRRYPFVFEEFRPSGSGVLPHVRLTPEVLSLDQDEQLIYDNPDHRQTAADRLLKLLMLTRVNKLPLHVIDRLRWDLGLPPDYVRTLVPDYPDYFQVTSVTSDTSPGSEVLALELVCWIDELAVSTMEKRAMAKSDPTFRKGMPLAFPLQFSRGFDMEKKVKKWVDEWQKLPYISPYENALHLQPKSDQAEKWTVAILHELLHLLVSKKTDRDHILCLGEQLGLRSRFKRALLNHPGIFYLSNKIRTHTVVLREAFKRDLLVEKHPMMGMRYQYIHLMNKGRDQSSGTSDGSRQQAWKTGATKGDDGSEDEQHEESYGSSWSEAEDVSDDDDADDNEEDEDDEDEDENESATRSAVLGRERMIRNPHIELKRPFRSSVQERSVGGYSNRRGDKNPETSGRRTSYRGHKAGVRS